MTRLIDADDLDKLMYHKSFEVDDGRNKWNSGLWIRYKIYEEAVRETPTAEAIPIDFIQKRIARLHELAEYDFEANGGYIGHAHAAEHELEKLIQDWKKRNSI